MSGDTAVYSGALSDYQIMVAGSVVEIRDKRTANSDDADRLVNVENFRFSNATFTLEQLGQIINQAPSGIAFTNATTSIAENTNTAASVKVADIFVIGDGIGTKTLSLGGGADTA